MRIICGFLLALLAAGCGEGRADDDGRLRVVTTTGMVRDVAAGVGGERVHAISLMGPGVDPHLYKASEGDVRRLWRADLILFNGLHLEARMAEVLERMGGRVRARAITDGIDRRRLVAPPEFAGAYDPHVWFDVRMWSETVGPVRDELAALDPAHAAEYRANAERYRARLLELDRYVREQAARVPPRQRVLVTAHDAFGYFGRAYGFEVRGLQGISTATEAGTADVQELARFIAERRVPAVFIESSLPQRTIQAVQAAVRARGFDVQIGGQLHSDALGDPGTPAEDYEGMVRHNIDTIVGALMRAPSPSRTR